MYDEQISRIFACAIGSSIVVQAPLPHFIDYGRGQYTSGGSLGCSLDSRLLNPILGPCMCLDKPTNDHCPNRPFDCNDIHCMSTVRVDQWVQAMSGAAVKSFSLLEERQTICNSLKIELCVRVFYQGPLLTEIANTLFVTRHTTAICCRRSNVYRDIFVGAKVCGGAALISFYYRGITSIYIVGTLRDIAHYSASSSYQLWRKIVVLPSHTFRLRKAARACTH